MQSQNKKCVAIYSMNGSITEQTALEFAYRIRSIPSREQAVDALLIRLESGGGSLGAAQSITESMDVLMSELSIPTVAFVCDQALSAAFLIACSAQRCIATPSALLGNTGAIIRSIDASAALSKLGVEYVASSTGPLKDSLFPASAKTDDIKAHLDEVTQANADAFMEALKTRRDISVATVEMLATGALINGAQALEHGLIDANGGFLMAISEAISLSGGVEADLVDLSASSGKARSGGGLLSDLIDFAGKLSNG